MYFSGKSLIVLMFILFDICNGMLVDPYLFELAAAAKLHCYHIDSPRPVCARVKIQVVGCQFQ